LSPDADQLEDAGLRRRRETIRTSLRRVNTLMLGILLLVVALALTALLQARRVERETSRALAATSHAETLRQEQRTALLDQARAWRKQDAAGQWARARQALQAAAKIQPSSDLREEALAWMPYAEVKEGPWLRFQQPTGNIAFDADVRRAALCWDNDEVHLFDLESGKELYALPDSRNSVGWLRFSPDGRWLVARHHATATNGILWNLETRTVARRFRAAQGIFTDGAYDFSPDSRRLASADQSGGVRIYDLVADNPSLTLGTGFTAHSLRFSPDGERLALGAGGFVEVWDIASRRPLGRFETGFYVDWVSWHPAGEWVCFNGLSGDVVLWHWRTGGRWQIRTGETRILQAHFHPAGHRLVTWSHDNTVAEWDIGAVQPLMVMEKRRADHYSADGRRLSLVDMERGCSFAALPEREAYRSSLEAGNPVRSLAWLGALLLRANDQGVELWNPATGRREDFQSWPAAKQVRLVGGGAAGVAVGEQGWVRWPLQQTDLGRWRLGEPVKHALKADEVEEMALAPGGDFVALRGSRGIQLHSIKQPETAIVVPDSSGFTRPAFSPDGQKLAACSTNGCVLWNTRTGGRITHLKGEASAIAFSPGGRYFVTGGPETLTVHDAADLKPLWHASLDGGALPVRLAFSPDEQWLAAGFAGGSLALYRSEGLERLVRFDRPRPLSIRELCFNDAGTQLAVLSDGGNVFLWDIGLMREQLADMRLDFDQPMLAAAVVQLPAGSGGLVPLALGGALLAILLGLLALQRYRKLVEGYFEVDALAARRHEQLAQAQAELLHSQKMRALGTLASGIAHDFNNLLSVIRMSNRLASRAAKDNPAVQENAAEIEQAVEQGKSVVRSMLGYSREAADDGQPYHVAELVENVVTLLGKQFLSGITLTLELEPGLPPVRVPKARLEQILLNLIVNASEAMNGQGKLLLAARRAEPGGGAFILAPREAGQHIEVVVADSGAGIAPEVRSRVFEPFFTTKNVGAARGTGLGLSMVHTIAREDGLGIALESAPGKGATFRIVIPVATESNP
jgi:signal transduction histidine kinase